MWIFLIAAVLLLAVIYFLNVTGNGVETIDKAFAGSPKEGSTVLELERGINKTIYTENGVPVDLSSMRRFVIEGKSLEQVGLKDGTIVYTVKGFDKDNLTLLIGRFIILRIDNERTAKEHPDFQKIEGFKARKVVDLFPTGMGKDAFENRMKPLLEKDNDVADLDKCLDRLWEKYSFASEYYHVEKVLIVSITYKEGVQKDYSFHSPAWLEGIVRYKNQE